MAEPQAAFNALVELARRSRRSASGLPAQREIQPHWSGIGFQLLGWQFAAPIGEVSELLEIPDYSNLPGVQDWVLGVANVRGRLLPLIDLAAFFGGELATQRKQQRALVLESGEFYTGLLVDAVFGMQHFPTDSFSSDLESLDSQLEEFVIGSYTRNRGKSDNAEPWYVFSPLRLLDSARFNNAAA